MGIRQTLNDKPWVGIAFAVGLLGVAAIVVAAVLKPTKPPTITQGYFSDDDGETVFLDDMNRVPPYQHNGKTAYGSRVYKTSSGKKVIGFLQKFDDDWKKKLDAAIAQATAQGQPISSVSLLNSMEMGVHTLIKLPGNHPWVSMLSDEGHGIMVSPPPTPDGSSIFEIDTPTN